MIRGLRHRLLLGTALAAALVLAPAGHAGTATHLVLTIQANVQSGKPVAVTVTARDAANAVATGYSGTVHFTSSDTRADLPSDYLFGPGDSGKHVFSVTLHTLGSRSVTVGDTAAPSLHDSATVSVGPQRLCGTLAADKHLSSGDSAYYLLTCDLIVPAGKTLTGAQSTAVVALPGTGISVRGTLQILGTSAHPVRFLDSKQFAGGPPARGDWKGITVVRVSALAPSPQLALDYAHVYYAGIRTFNAETVLISHLTVHSAPASGVSVVMRPASTSYPAVQNTTVLGSGGPAFTVSGQALNPSNLSGNAASGNGANEMRLFGRVNGGTFSGTLPFRIPGGTTFRFAGVATVDAPLFASPDAKLTFESGAGLFVHNGSFAADGSSGHPVTITSSSGSPVAGSWTGLTGSGPGSLVYLRYADIRYAGLYSAGGGGVFVVSSSIDSAPGNAIEILEATPARPPTVQQTRITHAGQKAVRIVSNAPLPGGDLGDNLGANNGENVLSVNFVPNPPVPSGSPSGGLTPLTVQILP